MVSGVDCPGAYIVRSKKFQSVGMTPEAVEPFQDEPPTGESLTPYDRAHMALYLRLLDAHRDGADWREVVEVLFGLDPGSEPDRCRSIHDSHLARARWLSKQGYRELLRDSRR